MAERRHYSEVTHDYRLGTVAVSLNEALTLVSNKPFNFGSISIGKEDFDGEDGDTIAYTCGGIPKDILMNMLRLGAEQLRARLDERGVGDL